MRRDSETLAGLITDIDLEKHFRRNDAGSWTCILPVGFGVQRGRIDIAVGTTFTLGTNITGVDIAFVLETEYERRQRAQGQLIL
jgi:hypothetical protein